MKVFFERALTNVTRHGDTDIFPFPMENHVFFDKREDTLKLLSDIDKEFKSSLVKYPPHNESTLAPVSYVGFRWATQLDPLWNTYFLGLVLSISEHIEAARVPISENNVFSYRIKWNEKTGDIFDPAQNWRAFMNFSMIKAASSSFVVVCDISEFYPRINHHRLENSLKHLNLQGDVITKITDFLSNFSGTNSFGIPVGGPAARILSELVLNQIDMLLKMNGVAFCRFADDYHIFADSYEQAFAHLVFLSEKLLRNQGLQLQKSKTRIMSGSEFIATSPIATEETLNPHPDGAELSVHRPRALLGLSLRFDPYSPTAGDDYEVLKKEIEKFDVIGLLRDELTKSRIHISLTRKIVTAIRYIEQSQRDAAVLSLINNPDLLYPIYTNVLNVARQLYSELGQETQDNIISRVADLVRSQTLIAKISLNLHYAIRLLSCKKNAQTEEILIEIFKNTDSENIKRDIIIILARWRCWYWVSDLRNKFRTLSAPERRAFIAASYMLKDEGKHWREHMKMEMSPFETLVKNWCSTKVSQQNWDIPL